MGPRAVAPLPVMVETGCSRAWKHVGDTGASFSTLHVLTMDPGGPRVAGEPGFMMLRSLCGKERPRDVARGGTDVPQSGTPGLCSWDLFLSGPGPTTG